MGSRVLAILVVGSAVIGLGVFVNGQEAPKAVPRDPKQPTKTSVMAAPTVGRPVVSAEAKAPSASESMSTGPKLKAVAANAAGLDTAHGCAGEWSRAHGILQNAPECGNHLLVRSAADSQDAWNRANSCMPGKVLQTEYFEEGVRLVCAPYCICG